MLINLFKNLKTKFGNEIDDRIYDWNKNNIKEETTAKTYREKAKSKMSEISIIANKTGNSSFNNNNSNFSALLNITTSTPPLEITNTLQPVEDNTHTFNNKNNDDNNNNNNTNSLIKDIMIANDTKLKEKRTKLSVKDISPENSALKEKENQNTSPEGQKEIDNKKLKNKKTNHNKDKDGNELCFCIVI